MYRNKSNGTALWAIAAMAAPLAHYSGRGYMAVILAAAAILPLNFLHRNGIGDEGRMVSFLEWLWAGAVLAHLIPGVSDYWTGGGKAVPLALVTLAALGGDREKASRTGNALFWLAVPIMGLILLLASGKIEADWLRPVPEDWSAELLIAFLLPGLVYGLIWGESGKIGTVCCSGALAVGLALLIQGCLSVSTAVQVSAPLYEVGRTVGAGTEILVSVGMTLSWYALCSLLFQIAMRYASGCGITGKWGRGITWGIVSAMLLMEFRMSGMVLLIGCLIFWIILHFLPLKK